MAKAKITVIKKISATDLYGENLPVEPNEKMFSPVCDQFDLGQEFILDNINCPAGFCNWAFADIQRDLVHIFFRGNYPWIKDKGCAISCCTDGLRPVVFKIERIEA
ncbi:MAG: TIGR04076 family protein [bacterium]|nr:TIGR04076 family protein [bacterium]